jgi:hypothetical protein
MTMHACVCPAESRHRVLVDADGTYMASERYPVLILSSSLEPLTLFPITTCSSTHALKAVWQGRVRLVSTYERIIRAGDSSFFLPSVVSIRTFLSDGYRRSKEKDLAVKPFRQVRLPLSSSSSVCDHRLHCNHNHHRPPPPHDHHHHSSSLTECLPPRRLPLLLLRAAVRQARADPRPRRPPLHGRGLLLAEPCHVLPGLQLEVSGGGAE